MIIEINVIYVLNTKSQGSTMWSDLTGKTRVFTISWCSTTSLSLSVIERTFITQLLVHLQTRPSLSLVSTLGLSSWTSTLSSWTITHCCITDELGSHSLWCYYTYAWSSNINLLISEFLNLHIQLLANHLSNFCSCSGPLPQVMWESWNNFDTALSQQPCLIIQEVDLKLMLLQVEPPCPLPCLVGVHGFRLPVISLTITLRNLTINLEVSGDACMLFQGHTCILEFCSQLHDTLSAPHLTKNTPRAKLT